MPRPNSDTQTIATTWITASRPRSLGPRYRAMTIEPMNPMTRTPTSPTAEMAAPRRSVRVALGWDSGETSLVSTMRFRRRHEATLRRDVAPPSASPNSTRFERDRCRLRRRSRGRRADEAEARRDPGRDEGAAVAGRRRVHAAGGAARRPGGAPGGVRGATWRHDPGLRAGAAQR